MIIFMSSGWFKTKFIFTVVTVAISEDKGGVNSVDYKLLHITLAISTSTT